jgi:hypothetical protein
VYSSFSSFFSVQSELDFDSLTAHSLKSRWSCFSFSLAKSSSEYFICLPLRMIAW